MRRWLVFGAVVCWVAPSIGQPPRAYAEEARSAGSLSKWSNYIDEAAQRFNLPKAWIEGVILAESAGQSMRDRRPITSRAGAMGLMQLMPDTYAEMQLAYGLGSDPYDPHDNIIAGTAYLRAMYERFGYPGLFGAYNAGPARYEAHLRGENLPEETRLYLARLTQGGTPLRSGKGIFVGLSSQMKAEQGEANSSLFVILRGSNTPEK